MIWWIVFPPMQPFAVNGVVHPEPINCRWLGVAYLEPIDCSWLDVAYPEPINCNQSSAADSSQWTESIADDWVWRIQINHLSWLGVAYPEPINCSWLGVAYPELIRAHLGVDWRPWPVQCVVNLGAWCLGGQVNLAVPVHGAGHRLQDEGLTCALRC